MRDVAGVIDAALRPILDCVAEGVCLAVPDPWRVVYANEALLSRLETASGEGRGRTLDDLFPVLRSGDGLANLDRVLCGDFDEITLSTASPGEPPGPFQTLCIRRVSVGARPLLAVVARTARPETSPLNALPMARVDPLTGLPDRVFLLDRLATLLNSCRETDQQFAALFLDLDDFKPVNDTHGHLVGDGVLCEVARRLAACVRAGDHVVRYGGDEFVVLVEQVYDMNDVQPVIDRIHASLRKPFALPNGAATLSASIGVVVAGLEHHTAEALLAAADRAMYASKRLGS